MDKQIPEFKNEDEEREFWATHDSSKYVDWSKAVRAVFPNLKSSMHPIHLTGQSQKREYRPSEKK